jgi:hypothetical protein
MDQDGLEKRIAELEARLVQQKAGADLPPTNTDAGDPPAAAPAEVIRCLLHQFPSKWWKRPLAVEFGAGQVSIIDPKKDALIASASRAQVTVTPAMFDADPSSDKTDTTMPVLIVGVPGVQPLTTGCYESRTGRGVVDRVWASTGRDLRFWWRGEVPWVKPPAYVTSAADWRALVENFGLAPYLQDNVDAQPGWGDREWIASRQDVAAAAKTGRDRRSARRWGYTTVGVAVAMLLLFLGAQRYHDYQAGTPTTATVTDCATDEHSTCRGTWSIGGVAGAGNLQQTAPVGSTVNVRVSNGKTYGPTQGLKLALVGGGLLALVLFLFVLDRSRRGTVVKRRI